MKKKIDIREYLLISIGTFLVALALHLFFIPAHLAAGGVSGLGIVLNEVFPVLDEQTYISVLNFILFVVGFIFLGKSFGTKTIYSSLFMIGALYGLKFILPSVQITDDLFLNTMFGTLIAASGMALVFNQDASTGGTDILAKILNKYFHIDIGKSLLLVDAIVTALGLFIFGPKIGLYSILSVLMNGVLIDRLILGTKSAKEIMIMSKENEKIRKFIIDELERSCTVLKGYGGYTLKDVETLYVVLNRSDFIKLKHFIKETDNRAFLCVNEVHEVLGEGYDDLSVI